MRVNIYHEELTENVEILSTSPRLGVRFYGVRFYLKSAPELHNTPTDDDRSAVTFWLGTQKEAERFFTNALHTIKQS